jgi:hypothetical protein
MRLRRRSTYDFRKPMKRRCIFKAMEQVKSPDGAGEVVSAVDILVDFQALRNRANFLLGEMLDALLDVSR